MATTNFDRLSNLINLMNKRLKVDDATKIHCEKAGKLALIYDAFEKRFVKLTDAKLSEVGGKLRECKSLADFWVFIDGTTRKPRPRAK